MMRGSIVRRLAVVEAVLYAKDAPPPEGISALLTWARAQPPVDKDEDDAPTRPLSGMARLLSEAEEFLKKGHDHHG